MSSHASVNRPVVSTSPLPRPTVDVPLLDGTALTGQDGLVEEELLVEEVSIDGMCGVY